MKISKTKDGQVSIDILGSLKTRKQKITAITASVSIALIASGAVFAQQMKKHGVGYTALFPSFGSAPSQPPPPQPSAPVAAQPPAAPSQPRKATNNPSGGLPMSRKQEDAIALFGVAMATTEGMDEWISDVQPGYDNGQVTITVTPYFLSQGQAVQLEVASILAESWEKVYQPEAPARSHLRLVNSQGQKIGGHDTFGTLKMQES